MILQISNEEAINFLKSNKKKEDYIFIRKHDIWYTYKEKEKFLSIVGIDIKNNVIKIGGSLTLKEYRKKGFFSMLIKEIIKNYENYIFICYANNSSKNIFKKLEFKKIRMLKNGTEYLKYEIKGV